MRDGEQSPGASMSLEEKLQISRVFDELGIDIIEAGFPIASPGDFEAVSEVSKILKKSIPCGLSRHTKKDIDACKDALKSAERFPGTEAPTEDISKVPPPPGRPKKSPFHSS